MSGLINSFLIEPVVRHARRFSGTNYPSSPSPLSSDAEQRSSSHVIPAPHTIPSTSSANFDDGRNAGELSSISHTDSISRGSNYVVASSAAASPGKKNVAATSPSLLTARQPLEDDNSEDRLTDPDTYTLQEAQTQHDEDQDSSSQPEDSNRIPEVARENGLQGLIPMDDMRTNYVFAREEGVMSPSPMQVDDEIQQPIPLLASDRPDVAPNLNRDSAVDSLQSLSMDDRLDDSLRSMSLDDVPETSRNPSLSAVSSLRNQLPASSSNSLHSSRDADHASLAPSERSRMSAEATSSELPEDDGMSALRQKLHKIRDMALSTEEKAKRMHALMISDLRKFKHLASKSQPPSQQQESNRNQATNVTDVQDTSDPKQKSQSTGSGSVYGRGKASSNASTFDSIAHFYISPEDLEPTYQPQEDTLHESSPEEENTDEEEELHLGCVHYRRNVKIQCADCRRWYTCRLCHDEAESHSLNRKKTKNMLCMLCGQPQPAAEYCRQCGELAANYYCDICKLWDNDPARKIYHCHDCGICRRGEGLGKDYVHCKKCNVCISIAWAPTHRCVERATECDCPICGEWMFTSSASVVAMRCGHYIHRSCYDQYMKVSYKCPICNRSAVNMELQWRKLDRHIEAQPMPPQWRNTMVWVTCNDCAARCYTAYHWLGNKCNVCDSYNTNEVKLDNVPVEHGQPIVGENGQPTQRPADPRVLEDMPEASLRADMDVVPAESAAARTALQTSPMPPLMTTDLEDQTKDMEDSPSPSSPQDIVPSYSNETATPHSPPQAPYQVNAAVSPVAPASSSQADHRKNFEPHSRRSIKFANGAAEASSAIHTDQELASTLPASPSSPASLSSLPGPSSPAPASMPLPSSPPFAGSPLSAAVISSPDENDDEVDDYDSEEEMTFWGSMAISPSSWGVSIPSVSMPTMNIPSVSLPSPISVGWTGSPRFFSGVWGSGSPAVSATPVGAEGAGRAGLKEAGSRSVRSLESLRSGASSGISRFWQMNMSSTDEEEEEDEKDEQEDDQHEDGDDDYDGEDDESGSSEDESDEDAMEILGHR